jgi:SecD/SecF fusion protein
VAIGGLIVYGCYFFALIKLIPVTLTLAGIAGLILTIGVAADANIVIFERVKEEIRGGRSIAAGIAQGYKKGFAAIVDANVVTIMVAFILFVLSSADVKGFALTLGLGTIVSLFTAVLATQAALGVMSRSRLISSPALIGAGGKRHAWTFDFMGASKWFFSLSGCILLIGALAIGGKGINFGIDFKGGSEVQAALVQPATQAQVASTMSSLGYSTADVQKYSHLGPNGFQIATKKLSPDNVTKVQDALQNRFGIKPGTFNNVSIGASFGNTIAKAAVIAIITSLIVISLYIALRFEWKYAVPVLIALMHDLLITSGVYALTGRQVTADTVAALLTILGYSLYDTIIVFDRVRENVPRMPRAAFSQIVNRSMSEVITRSLATTLVTLLPIVSLLIFGGTTLKDFAFALLIGVASGAYSSIFIASPVLTHWKEREPLYRNRRERIISEVGAVPAYATAVSGAPVDVEPEAKRRRNRRGSIIAPETPGEQISKSEFAELVRDLDVEGQPSSEPAATGGTGARRGRSATAAASAPPAPVAPAEPDGDATETAPEVDPTADALPEDVVMKSQSRTTGKPRRNRRHGRR